MFRSEAYNPSIIGFMSHHPNQESRFIFSCVVINFNGFARYCLSGLRILNQVFFAESHLRTSFYRNLIQDGSSTPFNDFSVPLISRKEAETSASFPRCMDSFSSLTKKQIALPFSSSSPTKI